MPRTSSLCCRLHPHRRYFVVFFFTRYLIAREDPSLLAAQWRTVRWLMSRALKFAPRDSSSFNTKYFPVPAASCAGVRAMKSVALTLALSSHNVMTAGLFPSRAATWRAVSPTLFTTSTHIGRLTISWICVTLPHLATQCNAVLPNISDILVGDELNRLDDSSPSLIVNSSTNSKNSRVDNKAAHGSEILRNRVGFRSEIRSPPILSKTTYFLSVGIVKS